MRNSSTSSSEASPVGETEPGVSEEVNGEDTAGGSSNDTQTDDGGLCPKCGSNEDPQFIHYRKFEKLVDSNYGAFIWRYCCARKDCAEFFGDYYAYDKQKTPLNDCQYYHLMKTYLLTKTPLNKQISWSRPNVVEQPSAQTPQKSSRRQKQTSRKKTAVHNKTKNSANSKPKEGSPRSSSRKQSNSSDPTKLSPAGAPKKLRKGYVYEVVPVEPTPRIPLDINSLMASGYGVSSTSESSTQTMGGAHFFSILVDQVVNGKAEQCAGLSTDEPTTLPSYVSRRLMISQQLMKRQIDEVNRVHEENKRLRVVLNLMNSVIRKFGDEYTSELRHLRDTIGVLKREFSFYQEEFVAEAKKSIDNILAQKEEIQRKIDDVERKNRLLTTRIELHIKEKEAVEERADGYLREISARDRDVILANKSRDRAERKLNDTLYVANNAKCAHCQISDKMRAHLTDVVAEKTVLLEKCRKECTDLQRRADHSERISRILSKDSEKLKFELNNWKSDAERNLAEISRLKEELKKASSGRPYGKSREKADNLTQQPTFTSSPALSGSDGKSCTPTDSAGSHTQEEQINTPPSTTVKATCNAAVQVTPVETTPLEEPESPFSSWLPKERKKESSPPVSFFNAVTVPAKRQSHQSTPVPLKKPHPFNGPVITDRSMSKQGTSVAPPAFVKGAEIKTVAKGIEWTPGVCSSDASGRSDHIPTHNTASGKPVEKVLRMPPKNTNSNTAEAPSANNDTQPRFFNTIVPSKIKPSLEQTAVRPEMLPRKETRKRKSSIVEYLEQVDASRAAIIAPVLPFNGPISLSSVQHSRALHYHGTGITHPEKVILGDPPVVR
ncbi:hypothetical protein COOONC_06966 [Cooperia oncophora]